MPKSIAMALIAYAFSISVAEIPAFLRWHTLFLTFVKSSIIFSTENEQSDIS